MTNTKPTAAQPLDLDKLEALAKAAKNGRPSADVNLMLAMDADTTLALIAQARTARLEQVNIGGCPFCGRSGDCSATCEGAARLDTTASASIDTPEFRALEADFVAATIDLSTQDHHGDNGLLFAARSALIRYIDSRAAQPVQAGEAVDKLRERVLEAWENYERMGEVCAFEGNPMIYASTLEELAELARATLAPVAVQQAAAQTNSSSNSSTNCPVSAAKAPAAQAVNYSATKEYSDWFYAHRNKLRGQSIFTKGAVIWNAACAASPASTPEASQQAAAVAAPSDHDEAVLLLAAVFDAWENGTQCYEYPDECAGYLGTAFRLDDEVFDRCLSLLNRTNPPKNAATSAVAATTSEDARAIGNRMAETLRVLTQAIKDPYSASATTRLIDEWARATQQEGGK